MNHPDIGPLADTGTRAGKQYVVSRRIATGGMAEVLLAARTGIAGFEKLVVLKRILPHLREDGQFLQMFLNEARLAALLKHPNIVEIYDVERSAEDFVVVMEYLSGEDLRYLIGHLRQEQKPMDIGVACRVISDAAAALEFAHTAEDMEGKPMGVVHRDVAPGNILVTYDGVTKLLDFGIAKATTRATYTVPGTMKGKFAYMSPEHIQQRPLDGRSDLFSLGVVFWELLCAQRLFKGANDAAVIKEVMERDIPAPSTVASDLPPSLDEIVMGCLERDPQNRTASARDLREQLQELLHATERYVTNTNVAEWMKGALPWRFHQRREMERTVTREAREGSGTQMTSLPGLTELNPGGGGASPSAQPFRGLPPSQHPAHSSIRNVSQISRPGYARPMSRRWGAVPTILVAAAATLLLVVLAAGFYWLGQNLNRETRATIVVHAVPEGSTLTVNGRVIPRPVGATGIAVTMRPGQRVVLVVAKPGRISQQRTVIGPEAGTHHMYFTLPRAL